MVKVTNKAEKARNMPTWKDKVRRLTRDKNLAAVGRRADYPDLAQRLKEPARDMPLSDRGNRLAAALGVPPEWLFDDGQDFPPPNRTESGVTASDLTRAIMEQLHAALHTALHGVDPAITRIVAAWPPNLLARLQGADDATLRAHFAHVERLFDENNLTALEEFDAIVWQPVERVAAKVRKRRHKAAG